MVDSPVVKVEEGQLQGKLGHSPNGKAYYLFQGVPYAKPPIGSLRFKAPQPPEPWEGIRDATAEGNSSAQIDAFYLRKYIGDENCLYLNVYTPNLDGEFLPVMVYIHGGGFRFGSSSSYLYGGDYLVEKDVVVVTINYRCGALGFLSLDTPDVPGNAGLKDVAQAIRWVKQNIKSFGGNSGNLTVFGESAGGVTVSLLTASPLTKNLISKAVIQSGTALCNWAFQNNPLNNAMTLARALGCESTDVNEIYEYLLTTPVKDMVEACEKMNLTEAFYTGKTLFGPVVEKEFPGIEAFLPEAFIGVLTSGRVADIPIMIGSTSLEFTFDLDDDIQLSIPSELRIAHNSEESLAIAEDIKNLYFKDVDNDTAKYQLNSDFLINIGTHRYVQYILNVKNKPVYYYIFSYVGEMNISKSLIKSVSLNYAGHTDELGYLFKNDLVKDIEPTPQDIKMRERMVRLWTNFAKTGNPTPDENHCVNVTWLPATKDKLYYLNISNELTVGTYPNKEKMEFWDSLYTKYFKIWEEPEPNNAIVTKSEVVIVDTSPVIVEETVITSVTTVIDEKGNQKVNTEVLLDVIDSTGQHYQETFNDLKGNVEECLEQNQNNSDKNESVFVVQENVVDVKPDILITGNNIVDEHPEKLVNIVKLQEKFSHNGGEEFKYNGAADRKPRPSNEIKMAQNNAMNPKDVIRANDPPEDDLPKNIGVNKFVNFFESLGGKK